MKHVNGIDVWGQLWDIATSEEGKPATITLDEEDAGYVELTWPDRSVSSYSWDAGEWHRLEPGCVIRPCDVAARDAL